MSILDDSRKLASLDPGRMYDAIAGFPGQVRRAVAIGRDVTVDVYRYTDLTGIVVCGMGGSAIGGDLARSLLQNHLAVPMQAPPIPATPRRRWRLLIRRSASTAVFLP
jgi:glucose/mannose-6-phosphate isomerase